MAVSSLLRGQRSQEHGLGWGDRQRGGGSGVLGKGGNRDGHSEESKAWNSTGKDGSRRSGSLKVDSGWCVCVLRGSLRGMLQGSAPRWGDSSRGTEGELAVADRHQPACRTSSLGLGLRHPAVTTHGHGLLRASAWPWVGRLFSAKGNGSLSQPVGMALQTLRRLGLGSRAPTWWVMRVAVLVLLWPRAPLPWNFVTLSHGPLVPFPFSHPGPHVLS